MPALGSELTPITLAGTQAAQLSVYSVPVTHSTHLRSATQRKRVRVRTDMCILQPSVATDQSMEQPTLCSFQKAFQHMAPAAPRCTSCCGSDMPLQVFLQDPPPACRAAACSLTITVPTWACGFSMLPTAARTACAHTITCRPCNVWPTFVAGRMHLAP